MKTARQLGITEDELDALIAVRDMLPGMVHAEEVCEPQPQGQLFNMNYADLETECGTVHCIGGWMATLLPLPLSSVRIGRYVNSERSNALGPLFFPRELDEIAPFRSWAEITPAQAVQAINNFLEHGDPRWLKVMREV